MDERASPVLESGTGSEVDSESGCTRQLSPIQVGTPSLGNRYADRNTYPESAAKARTSSISKKVYHSTTVMRLGGPWRLTGLMLYRP